MQLKDMIKSLLSVKVGGGVLDGSQKGFDAIMRMIRGFFGIIFLTISAKKGVTAELDKVYEKAIVANTDDEKRFVRENLRHICTSHSEIVWPLLHSQGFHKRISHSAMSESRHLCDRIAREASEVLESLLKVREQEDRDSDRSKQAAIQSFGERINTGLVDIYLRAQGYLTIHFDARKFVRATPGPGGLFIGAIVDREATIDALARQIKDVVASLSTLSSYKGVVFLIEGFVAGYRGEVVTLGYDGSDLTACIVAEAIKLAGLSDTATVELLKSLDRPLESSSLEKLLKNLRTKHSGLVGPQAMIYAIKNRVTIMVTDVKTFKKYKFAPRFPAWFVWLRDLFIKQHPG